MKRFLFLLLLLLAGKSSTYAAGFPKISNDAQEYWYYMKFTQGAFVIASNGDDVVCKSLIPMGRNSQLWKVEGSSSAGYTFTKFGKMDFVSSARVYVAAQRPFSYFTYNGFTTEIGGSPIASGIDTSTHPLQAIYTLGVKLNFK